MGKFKRRRSTARYGRKTKSAVVDLGNVLQGILDEYETSIQNDVVDAFNEVVPKIATQLQNSSLSQFPKGSFYASGWTTETTEDAVGTLKVITYNKNQPTLTHLLENGHRGYPLKNGGRTRNVRGRKHIKPVQEWVEEETTKLIERKLKQ